VSVTPVPPPRRADQLDARATVILLVLCACWGVNQAAIKIANNGISPIIQAGLRSLLAGALVLLWAHARGLALFERDGTFWSGLLVGALVAVGIILVNGSRHGLCNANLPLDLGHPSLVSRKASWPDGRCRVWWPLRPKRSGEESPGSRDQRWRLTAAGGNPRESATENKPPQRA
jgi:hypothetical protein